MTSKQLIFSQALRLVDVQQVQPAVDALDESALPCERVDRPDATAGEAARPVRLVPETILILAPTTGEFLAYAAVHSKCLVAQEWRMLDT